MKWFVLLPFLFQSVEIFGVKLPDYFHPCHLSDPEFGKCCVKSANEILPHIMNGVKELNIPQLSPFKIPEISFQTAGNLKFKFTDVVLIGLETAHCEDAIISLNDRNGRGTLYFTKVNFVGTYNIDGRILLLPITGDGPANITYEGVTVKVNWTYNIKPVNGVGYMTINKLNLTHDIKHGYYQFDNLFNGDKRLGDEMNKFLNENWEVINKDIGSFVSDVIKSIVLKLATGVTSVVPFHELYLD